MDAAKALREVPGQEVTRALAEALGRRHSGHAGSHRILLARDDPLTVDLIWDAALLTLDEMTT